MIQSAALVVALVLSCAGSLGCAGSAMAQSAEDQAACQDDAFRVCSHTIPDRERTFQCMIAQKDALSPACRTVIARSLPDATPQKAAAAPRTKKGGPINLNPAAAR
jgi:hypothetical protein